MFISEGGTLMRRPVVHGARVSALAFSLVIALGSAAGAQPSAFQDDELLVLQGLPVPNLKRRTEKGPTKGSLAFEHPSVREPWFVQVKRKKISLWWPTVGMDTQKVFPFTKAVAVVSKNACGEEFKLVEKTMKIDSEGTIGACNVVVKTENDIVTVALTPAHAAERRTGPAGAEVLTKEMRKARTSEAYGTMAKIWAGSIAYYESEHFDAKGKVLPKQFPGSVGLTPAKDCCAQGGQCQPDESATAWGHPVWQALNISMSYPIRFRAEYKSSGKGLMATFTIRVVGDIDCNGKASIYERVGRIDPNTGDVTGPDKPTITNEGE